MPEYDVIVYGTIALDAIWRVQELPAPGGYAPILEQCEMIGGEACNTAIALTCWGVRVALIGNAIGDDEHGRLLRELLARDAPDLDTQFIKTLPDAQTPYCVCIATPDGERTMYGTSFHDWQCATLDPDLARSARFFTMDPNGWEAGRQAAQIAARAGASVIPMDYTRDPTINQIATINLTSHTEAPDSTSWQEWSDYATDLRDTYGATAIVTCGPQGCLVAEAGKVGEAVHVPAYVAPVMVDGTGCGDMFRAGLIYGQLQAWELLRTVRFASAAAALNCGAMGGWGGVRSVQEIEAFQKEKGITESSK